MNGIFSVFAPHLEVQGQMNQWVGTFVADESESIAFLCSLMRNKLPTKMNKNCNFYQGVKLLFISDAVNSNKHFLVLLFITTYIFTNIYFNFCYRALNIKERLNQTNKNIPHN